MTDPLAFIRQNLGNSPASASQEWHKYPSARQLSIAGDPTHASPVDPLAAIRSKMGATSQPSPKGPLQLPMHSHPEARLAALESIANQIIATMKPGDQAKLRTELAGLTKKDWNVAK